MIRLPVLVLFLLLAGCAHEVVRYAPIPAGLIPPRPVYEKIGADELACLSDSAYERLVKRFQACEQDGRELRALLGAKQE